MSGAGAQPAFRRSRVYSVKMREGLTGVFIELIMDGNLGMINEWLISSRT